MSEPIPSNLPAPGAEPRQPASPDMPVLVRIDTPPANLLDLLDRQFTIISTSRAAVENLCIVLGFTAIVVCLATIAVSGLFSAVWTVVLWCVSGTGGGGVLYLIFRWGRRCRINWKRSRDAADGPEQ